MTDATQPKAPSKGILKTASKYKRRLEHGERIMRDALGRLQWADGKPVGPTTVRYMLETGEIRELDTDLFGDFSRGQTLGLNA